MNEIQDVAAILLSSMVRQSIFGSVSFGLGLQMGQVLSTGTLVVALVICLNFSVSICSVAKVVSFEDALGKELGLDRGIGHVNVRLCGKCPLRLRLCKS